MKATVELRGNACVAWLPSPHHRYEDRYRMLPVSIPLVAEAARGELHGVFDGVGSAPRGMAAAQFMADCLIRFIQQPRLGLPDLLTEANATIHGWGFIEGSTRPKGACAGTVAHIQYGEVSLFHCGDTCAFLLGEQGTTQLLTSTHEVDGAIFNYFGLGDGMQLETAQVSLGTDDFLLMVSDGVTKTFHQMEIARWMHEQIARTGDPIDSLRELVELARRRGSLDDITALLIASDDLG